MGELDGRVALVTGGARGQGRAHALRLAQDGADVTVVDLCAPLGTVPYPLADPDDLAQTAAQVEAIGRRCLTVTADVRDGAAIDAAVARTVDELGGLDICVANAGVCGFGRFWEITDEMWDEMIGVNLTGAFRTLRAVVPPMIDRGRGRVVATSSMGGRMGNANLAHYVASKWGVIGLVKTLAREVAEYGITVNAVCPATVDTPMVHNPALYGLFCPDLEHPDRDDVRTRYEAMNPMGNAWLDPAEVAAAVRYLVSDAAGHVTGTTLDVCMGASASMP